MAQSGDEKVQNEPYWKRFIDDDMEIDFSEISRYIKEELEENLTLIKQKKPSEPFEETTKNNQQLEYSIFEIIGCTIIRIPITPEIDIGQIEVLVETTELVITNESTSTAKIIPLQVKGAPDNSKAYFHEHILEIRIPHDTRKNYVKVPIVPL